MAGILPRRNGNWVGRAATRSDRPTLRIRLRNAPTTDVKHVTRVNQLPIDRSEARPGVRPGSTAVLPACGTIVDIPGSGWHLNGAGQSKNGNKHAAQRLMFHLRDDRFRRLQKQGLERDFILIVIVLSATQYSQR